MGIIHQLWGTGINMLKPSGGKGSSDFVLCGAIDPSPKGEAKERGR